MQVYVIGDVGIEEELKLKGINYIGGPSDADQKVELSAGYALPHDPDVSSMLSSCMSQNCIFMMGINF